MSSEPPGFGLQEQRALRRAIFKLRIRDVFKLVAFALLDFINWKTGETHVSTSALAAVTGLGHRTCQRAVAAMRRARFIKPTGAKGGYHNSQPVYAIAVASRYVCRDVAQTDRPTSSQSIDLRLSDTSTYVYSGHTKKNREGTVFMNVNTREADRSNRRNAPAARRVVRKTSNGKTKPPFIKDWLLDPKLVDEMGRLLGVLPRPGEGYDTYTPRVKAENARRWREYKGEE